MNRLHVFILLVLLFPWIGRAAESDSSRASSEEIREWIQSPFSETGIETEVLPGSDTPPRVAALGHHSKALAVSFGRRISFPTGEFGAADARVMVYSLEKTMPRQVSELIDETLGLPYGLSFSSDNARLLVGYEKGAVLWDLKTGRSLRKFQPNSIATMNKEIPPMVTDVAISEDSSRFALAGGVQITVYQQENEKESFTKHVHWIKFVKFATNDMFYAGHAGISNAVSFYDATSGALLKSFLCDAEPMTGEFETGNQRVFAVSRQQDDPSKADLYCWSFASGELEFKMTVGGSGSINGAKLDLETHRLILSTERDRITIWEYPEKKKIAAFGRGKILDVSRQHLVIERVKPVTIRHEQFPLSSLEENEERP